MTTSNQLSNIYDTPYAIDYDSARRFFLNRLNIQPSEISKFYQTNQQGVPVFTLPPDLESMFQSALKQVGSTTGLTQSQLNQRLASTIDPVAYEQAMQQQNQQNFIQNNTDQLALNFDAAQSRYTTLKRMYDVAEQINQTPQMASVFNGSTYVDAPNPAYANLVSEFDRLRSLGVAPDNVRYYNYRETLVPQLSQALSTYVTAENLYRGATQQEAQKAGAEALKIYGQAQPPRLEDQIKAASGTVSQITLPSGRTFEVTPTPAPTMAPTTTQQAKPPTASTVRSTVAAMAAPSTSFETILSSLPSDWNTYTPANKRFWFESQGVTRTDLEAAGVPATDLNALYAQAAAEKKSDQVTSGLLDTNDQTTNVTNQTAAGLLDTNISTTDASAVFQSLFGRAPTQQELAKFTSVADGDPRLASRTAFEAYLRGTPDYLALQQQKQLQPQSQQPQSQQPVGITQQQAIDTFQSIFGRVPNSTELASFLSYQRGSTPFTSTDALATYLRGTPDFAAYQARQALPPMTYGRAVVPQSQLQYGYGPEQGLLTNIKGPTGQQIQNQIDAFYAASYGGTPTAGLLAPIVAANQVTLPASFYAMPQGAPTAQQLAATGQGLLNTGATFNDLRAEAQKSNLSPQVTGSILSTLNQGASLPYVQGLLSGTLPLVAGENLLAYK